MPTERWVLCFEDATLWLHERIDNQVHDRRVTREELTRSYPALAAELKRTDFRDAPRVVCEP